LVQFRTYFALINPQLCYSMAIVEGVRWAIGIGLVAGAIAYFIYFKLGAWKHKLN